MMQFDVLIVGAGHAGAQTAIQLANAKYSGSIAIVSDEPELPYERPPLSKDYLAGARPFERMLIRAPQFWLDRNIRILSGHRVTAIDPAARTVRTHDDLTIGYGSLVWTAGGRPRQLTCSGFDLQGVHSVRCRSDVDRMIAELPNVQRVVVVGGGYIGLEAAAALVKMGKHVTVLEALPRVLARVAGTPISNFFEHEHRAHGVNLMTGVTVECVEGSLGKATGVRLADGRTFEADMVIVGIGIVPAIDPLLDVGAQAGNGVLVDEYCRTTLPNVYAAGDCAAHVNAFAGGARIRLESVQNANDQGATVARSILGNPTPYHAVPWFWSDQYDIKLQTVGLATNHDQFVLRGDPTSRSFSVIYLLQGRVIALDCVSATRDYVQGRKLVSDRTAVDVTKLADPAIQLKQLA